MNERARKQVLDQQIPLAVLALLLLLGISAAILFAVNRNTVVPASWGFAGGARRGLVEWFNLVQGALAIPLLSGIFGALILRRHVAPRIGWLFLLVGLSSAGQSFLIEYAILSAYTRSAPLFGAGVAALMGNSLWIWLYGSSLYLLAIFPNGRFLSARWRTAILILLALFVLPIVAAALIETPLSSAYQIENPFVPSRLTALYDTLFAVGIPVMPVIVITVLGAVLLRFRRSQGRERQQMKWLLLGVALMAVLVVLGLALFFGLEASIGGVLVNVSLLAPLLGIGVALLRHQLYDIDILIRKTLQYALLTALLALSYFGSVVLLQTLFGSFIGEQSPAVIVLSTLLIAALFTPLRRRVQELIDRRFFRQKYDAQQVLAAFAITARDETDLDQLTAELQRVVEETMQPEAGSVWLRKS